ncbi:MAG TPA: MarR family transcriptional regulator [Actinospica sp.]|nr:MarR family transcriptional regulator [Actinospica sp.]
MSETTGVPADAHDLLALPLLMFSGASTLVDAIHSRIEARGFAGLRPAHGFAFVRISAGGATIAEIGEYLGVTKQAASQLVDELLRKGYVMSSPHPRDARAKLITLTEQGRAVTRAADEASIEVAREWAEVLGEARVRELIADLGRVARAGKLKPLW